MVEQPQVCSNLRPRKDTHTVIPILAFREDEHGSTEHSLAACRGEVTGDSLAESKLHVLVCYANINNSCRRFGRVSQVGKCPTHLPFCNHMANTYSAQARAVFSVCEALQLACVPTCLTASTWQACCREQLFSSSLTSPHFLKPIQVCQCMARGKRGYPHFSTLNTRN